MTTSCDFREYWEDILPAYVPPQRLPPLFPRLPEPLLPMLAAVARLALMDSDIELFPPASVNVTHDPATPNAMVVEAHFTNPTEVTLRATRVGGFDADGQLVVSRDLGAAPVMFGPGMTIEFKWSFKYNHG